MTATLAAERAVELKAAHAIVTAVKADNRELNSDETSALEGHTAAIKSIDARMAAAKAGAAAIAALGDLGGHSEDQREQREDGAKSLGEFFVKHVGAKRFADLHAGDVKSVSAPEWLGVKASSTTQVTGDSVYTPYLTEYDTNIVRGLRTRLTIEDLLSAGTISGNAISYMVEGALEGAYTTVAEAGAKPQIHFVDPTARTDALKKIAAFLKISDEMAEDLPYIVSEINNRGLYQLGQFVEAQLLNGGGTGSDILGLLQRSGIPSALASASLDDNPDALFRAVTAISVATGLDADGIVINPADYQRLRLSRDANGQYFGGGFFQGQYGNGAILENPPIWGLRTVVTPAIAAGTALVAPFKQAATAYSKGGVRVESTNSHASDFTSNLITTRIETRKALAVRYPAALQRVTLATS